MQSTISIDLGGCPLFTTLPLVLRQISLLYHVRDGLVYITSMQTDDPTGEFDYYLLLGHSFLGLISASLGACLVPLVSERKELRTGR